MTHSSDSLNPKHSIEFSVKFISEENQFEDSRGSHCLSEFDFSEEHFIPQISCLIDRLKRRLNLSQPLTFTSKSLKVIERSLYSLYVNEHGNLAIPEIFEPLVAFLGEMCIHIYHGNWHFDLAYDGRTWLPSVVNKYGWKHTFVEDLIKYFIGGGYYIEEDRNIDLHHFVYMAGIPSIKVDILPLSVVEELISQSNVQVNESLSKPEYGRYAYNLPDGKLIVKTRSSGNLYKSVKAYERIFKDK
jgi:hypothetical protein